MAEEASDVFQRVLCLIASGFDVFDPLEPYLKISKTSGGFPMGNIHPSLINLWLMNDALMCRRFVCGASNLIKSGANRTKRLLLAR